MVARRASGRFSKHNRPTNPFSSAHTTPSFRCVVLFVQYIQLSSPSGQQGRILGWVASGIRVAQRLGLHRLGHNPQTMPPDDPALPPGKNAMKRDMAVRLWNQLVVIDSFLSDSPLFRCYLLHPSQCKMSGWMC